MIPGLLPIFLHGCEIKSGRGLGTRLAFSYKVDPLVPEELLSLILNNRVNTNLVWCQEVWPFSGSHQLSVDSSIASDGK